MLREILVIIVIIAVVTAYPLDSDNSSKRLQSRLQARKGGDRISSTTPSSSSNGRSWFSFRRNSKAATKDDKASLKPKSKSTDDAQDIETKPGKPKFPTPPLVLQKLGVLPPSVDHFTNNLGNVLTGARYLDVGQIVKSAVSLPGDGFVQKITFPVFDFIFTRPDQKKS